MLWAQRPIADVLADPETGPELRRVLSLALEARGFARELGLEVKDQYTSYAEWPGDRVVTALVATRPGEIEPTGFEFPLVGRVPYKGFFDPERAEAAAAELRQRELDVCLVPVTAYSTLGWLADPVTGPMTRRGDTALVETVIHELVHATLYVPSEADFNEGVASFIGQEGAVRFFDARGEPEVARRLRLEVRDQRAVARVLGALRSSIAALYAAGAAPPEARQALADEARAHLAALPLATRDAGALAASLRLNDACLALNGTYQADLDDYDARLAARDGDLPAFVEAVRAAAETDDPRAALLGRAP